jgi:septal ring factor EnvC (AmiA/AmiB activator)
MSTNDSNDTSSAATTTRDASMKVDSSALQGEDLDFAQLMGFGDDPEEESAPAAAPASEPAPVAEPAEPAEATEETAATEEPADSETPEIAAAEPDESSAPEEDPEEMAPPIAEPEPIAACEEDPDDRTDWEEIHPRPAADGNQTLLQARARNVLAQSERVPVHSEASESESSPALPDESAAPAAPIHAPPTESAPPEVIAASTDPADPGLLAELEKERDAAAAEFETLTTEHELLLDQFAALQGQFARSNDEVERLQASLRTARTALTPLPEGERALRAEVIGLRNRLEAAHAENQELSRQCESSATELAIAQARFEDRQHEVDVRLEDIQLLENELREAQASAGESAEKQRELVDLSSRLQAENNELRSAQAALEETLQARDLEIHAREEHLAVTREGLLARDRQIIDLKALLESTRDEVDRAETELARRDVESEQYRRAIERRENRIASLSETLAKIETVMGRRMDPIELPRVPSVPDEDLFRAETETQPGLDAEAESGFELELEDQAEAEAEPESSRNAGSESLESLAPARPARPLLVPWRNGCLSNWMRSMGAETVADYFAVHLALSFEDGWPTPLRVKSLGGDLLDAEIRLLEALENRGVSAVEVEVFESDGRRAEERAARAEAAGWGDQIRVHSGDRSEAEFEPKADAILLSDALFGRADAAAAIEWCEQALSETGLLLFVDQICGGEMTLSADTLSRLDEIWAVLPESLTALPGFAERPEDGEDGGVPTANGQEIQALFSRFDSRADVGFGHLADLVVGPARGASLSDSDPATKRLLYSIFGLDENRSITEGLPSRHGIGVFSRMAGESLAGSDEPLFAPEWLVRDADEESDPYSD